MKFRKGIIATFVLLLLLVGAYLFWNRASFNKNGVNVSIEGPQEVTGGDLVTYKVKYTNTNNIALENVTLDFFYPTDAIPFKDNTIQKIQHTAVKLDPIPKGGSGEQEFQAFIVGDRGNIKTAQVHFNFSPAGLSSVVQSDASLATTISNLAVPLTLVAPPTTVSGQQLTYLIDYRNESNQDLNDLRISAKYPDRFNITNSSPKPTAGNTTWDIPTLHAGDGARITVQGALSGAQDEHKTAVVILQKKIATATGDAYVDFEKVTADSVISTPPLSVSMAINNSTNYTAHLGDVLSYVISYRNSSDVTITGLNLSARLIGSMFDVSTVQVNNGFFDSATNTVIWNAGGVQEFNNLGPNQSGSVTFNVKLKNNFGGAIGASNSVVKVSAHLETPSVPAGINADRLFSEQDVVTAIATAPVFSQSVVSSNDQVGASGPMPPKVGTKSTLAVRWNLVNPSHDVSSAKVTATLAPGVTWGNAVSAGASQPNVQFNSKNNTITWDLGTLPGGVGVQFPAYDAKFLISITPSINQAGSPVALLKNVQFQGTDSFTKEKFLRTIPDTNTNEVAGSNSGIVEK